MLNKKCLFILLTLLMLFLNGCENDEKKAENIHKHLDKTVTLEKGFEAVQEPILNAEKKEQKLYEDIIKLSLNDFDQIKELTTKEIESAENRKKLVEKEKGSIEVAYNEFLLIEQVVAEIENENLQIQCNDMIKTMKERYDSYQKLNKAYNKGIELDIKLYQLLQDKDLSITDLEAHIEILNKQYEKIMDAKDIFNNNTEKFNESKKKFYKIAKLDVKMDY